MAAFSVWDHLITSGPKGPVLLQIFTAGLKACSNQWQETPQGLKAVFVIAL
jgi:hypothetical protein